ncbi:MAG TPA: cytidylate kinase-like family protein [Terriglobales bacterium]|nr:cytidylate kinase-like family protein [Terriglobales bacterium]
MRIITIEREYGCGTPVIAEKLAKRLGWKLWDQSLTDEIAKIAHVDISAAKRCDERLDPLVYRLAKTFWRGSYERSLPLSDPGAFDTDCMVAMVQQVIENAAKHGECVIVGRGAPYFLRDRSDAFHVFLFAPREYKVRRLMESGQSQEAAEELVDTVDQERAAFIKKYFGKDWPNRHLYHLMINTSMGDELVVETILNSMATVDRAAGVAR